VREVIGGDLPLVASLDLHANVTLRCGASGCTHRLPHLSPMSIWLDTGLRMSPDFVLAAEPRQDDTKLANRPFLQLP